jgi:hypothetical protein
MGNGRAQQLGTQQPRARTYAVSFSSICSRVICVGQGPSGAACSHPLHVERNDLRERTAKRAFDSLSSHSKSAGYWLLCMAMHGHRSQVASNFRLRLHTQQRKHACVSNMARYLNPATFPFRVDTVGMRSGRVACIRQAGVRCIPASID